MNTDAPVNKAEPHLLLFAGTADGRELALKLAALPAKITLSVATEYGRSLLSDLPDAVRVACGRMDQRAMREFFRRENPQAIIDATHPYAREAGRNIRAAAAAEGLPYFRLLRPQTLVEGCEIVPHAEAAAAVLRQDDGPVLLTVGVKELAAFTVLPNFADRFYVRVLPSVESLRECERLGFANKRVIAMQGPFSRELNVALLRQFGIKTLVTKDGGAAGGMPEKLAAAAEFGARVVVMGRPEAEVGGLTAEEICAAVARLEGVDI